MPVCSFIINIEMTLFQIFPGKEDIELATKVMQFALITDCGFRFALGHFPVSSLTPATLLEKFWEGVEWCLKANFRYKLNLVHYQITAV